MKPTYEELEHHCWCLEARLEEARAGEAFCAKITVWFMVGTIALLILQTIFRKL